VFIGIEIEIETIGEGVDNDADFEPGFRCTAHAT
jgi:hypothetical protein